MISGMLSNIRFISIPRNNRWPIITNIVTFSLNTVDFCIFDYELLPMDSEHTNNLNAYATNSLHQTIGVIHSKVLRTGIAKIIPVTIPDGYFLQSTINKTKTIPELYDEYKIAEDIPVISEECKKLLLGKNRYIVEIINQYLLFYRPDYLLNASDYDELISQLKFVNEGITFGKPDDSTALESTSHTLEGERMKDEGGSMNS
jgi:hypothetical protein